MSAPAQGDRIAFLVLAHAQPQQLARLVPLLAPGDGRADVFVHVDRKSPQAGFATALARAEVRFVAERHTVWWGGFGMVEAMCALLRAALAAGPDYAAFVFLSESCFPIRPLQDLHALIRARPGHNFIRFVDSRPHPELMRRIDRYWVWESPQAVTKAPSLAQVSGQMSAPWAVQRYEPISYSMQVISVRCG